MIEPPTGPALLDAARRTLLDELLPALPADKRYAALMVANAMAIAARVARAEPDAALDARAVALTGDAPDPWAALARAIRAGRYDPGTPDHDPARRLLGDHADARCAISSPKALRPQPI